MIDSHCHLDHLPLFKNLDDVLKRSNKSGVKYLLTISTSLKSFNNVKKIVNKYKNIYGTLGVHPHETSNYPNLNKKQLINLKKNNYKIIGIGETGLDYYYKNSNKLIQKKIFIEHIEAAIELNVPVIVHSREAEEDTFNILNKFSSKKPKILMHCFTGSQDFSKKLLNLDAFFSFSGIITFKNSTELQNTTKSIPLDKLLIETDSPFLAPEPKRGSPNEPSYIKYTAEKLAKLKSISFEEIINYTSNNFFKLFSLNL